MSLFSNGRIVGQRFRVQNGKDIGFGVDHLALLEKHKMGMSKSANKDGSEAGWTAGDHVLDLAFDLEKNIVNDTLQFEFRLDAHRPPANLRKAYYEQDLKALSKDNPSGFASARQKRTAKESANARMEEEVKAGRWRTRQAIPVMWDSQTGELLFGSASPSLIDRFLPHFRQTFEKNLVAMTATDRADEIATENLLEPIREVMPSNLSRSSSDKKSPVEIAWASNLSNRDWLGNELLLWLWWMANDTDTLSLSDHSELTFMFARKLQLDCPRGQTGKETIAHDSPIKLVEAVKAVQSGKLPRKAGLTLVRQQEVYEITLAAESLAVAAKLPKLSDGANARGQLEERVDQIRSLFETLDLMYEAFLVRRLSGEWESDLIEIRRWLGVREKATAAA